MALSTCECRCLLNACVYLVMTISFEVLFSVYQVPFVSLSSCLRRIMWFETSPFFTIKLNGKIRVQKNGSKSGADTIMCVMFVPAIDWTLDLNVACELRVSGSEHIAILAQCARHRFLNNVCIRVLTPCVLIK